LCQSHQGNYGIGQCGTCDHRLVFCRRHGPVEATFENTLNMGSWFLHGISTIWNTLKIVSNHPSNELSIWTHKFLSVNSFLFPTASKFACWTGLSLGSDRGIVSSISTSSIIPQCLLRLVRIVCITV
jgi:hypothetical protein